MCIRDSSETEWVETLIDGWNVLDVDLHHVSELAERPRPAGPQAQPYGDGRAASRVAQVLVLSLIHI